MPDQPRTFDMGGLLHQCGEDSTWDVREALFLTFTFDPGFFTRGVLGPCRALGARTTVLGDAHMWDPDPLTLGHAGLDYQLALASHPLAFHPKLNLLIGPDRVLATIGSGNVTLAGWQLNSELWNVAEAADGTAPPLLWEVAAWLAALPGRITLAEDGLRSLRRAAAELARTLEGCTPADDGRRLVSNLDHPAIEQLPSGPVDELILTAPFFDRRCAALEAILTRLRPRRTQLILQNGRTSIDPSALSALIRRHPGRILVYNDPGERPRHAKLVQWRTGDQWFALTGSYNVTSAALLRSTSNGGNVELGIVQAVSGSVWPDPGLDPVAPMKTLSPADIKTAPQADPASVARDEGTRPILLCAILRGELARVELAHPVPHPVTVEARVDPLRDPWSHVGVIPAGDRCADLPAAGLPDSVQFRLAWDALGSGRSSPVLPGTVPERLAVRPARTGDAASRRIRGASDLLGMDVSYLAAFAAQLEHIAQEVAALRSHAGDPGHLAQSPSHHHVPTDDGPLPWLWQEEDIAQAVHGPAVTAFALGLPAPPSVGAWESFDDDAAGDLEDDASHVEARATATPQAPPTDHHDHPESVKRARRTWVAKWAAEKRRFSATSCLTIARLTLCFYCAGDWDEHDAAPLRHLRAVLTRARDACAAVGRSEEYRALVAVALTSVRLRADYGVRDEATLAAVDVTRSFQEDLSSVPADLVSDYCRAIRAPSGHLLEPAQVFDDTADAAASGMWTEAIRNADALGWPSERVGTHALELTVPFSNPLPAALEALAFVAAPPAGVLAHTDTGSDALVLWDETGFYTARMAVPPIWEHFRAEAGVLALRESWRAEEWSRYRVNHGPRVTPIDHAVTLATSIGLGAAVDAAMAAPTPARIPTPPPRRASPQAGAGAALQRAGAEGGTSERYCPRCFTAVPASGVCDFCS